jgi:hypothetical protein
MRRSSRRFSFRRFWIDQNNQASAAEIGATHLGRVGEFGAGA